MFYVGSRVYSLDREIVGTIRGIRSYEHGIIEVLYDDNSHETSNIARYKILKSLQPHYFSLLREIAGCADASITDAQAFTLIKEIVTRNSKTNDQPLIADNFKEKELWKEVLQLFERLSNFTKCSRMHQFDLAREEDKFVEQVNRFKDTLAKTFV